MVSAQFASLLTCREESVKEMILHLSSNPNSISKNSTPNIAISNCVVDQMQETPLKILVHENSVEPLKEALREKLDELY